MTPSYAIKKGVRYRYYVSCVLAQARKEDAGSVKRVASNEIEDRVRAAVAEHFTAGDQSDLSDRDIVAANTVREAIERVTISATAITINLIAVGEASDPSTPIRLPWTPPRHTRHHKVIRNDADPADEKLGSRRSMKGEVRARIIVAIGKARLWLEQLTRGELTDIGAIAKREGRSERSVRMTLSLAFLAPDIVAAAIEGDLPPGLSMTDLTDLPMDWPEQRQRIGMSS